MFKDEKNQEEFEQFFLATEGSAGFFDPPITLKSGRPGYYYFDLRNFQNHRGTKRRLVGYVYDFCMEQELRPELFLGVPEGMTPIGSAMTELIDYLDDTPAAVLRTAPKGHGDPRDRSSIGRLEPGTKVVFVEDVTTTGGSGIKYTLSLQNAGVDVIGFVAVVNRLERRDGGLYVPEFFEQIMHVPYSSMTDAARLLPKMCRRDNPSTDVRLNTARYMREYCGKSLDIL